MHTMKSLLIYESNKNDINGNNNNSNNNNISNNNNNNNMQGHFESWENRNNNNFSQLNTNIASFTMASFNSPDNSPVLDNSNPETLNVKQSLQALRRINRLISSAMKKKQQLSTQNLIDHVNREAEIFGAVDNTSDEPINLFTIKEQRHSNDFDSDNESDH